MIPELGHAALILALSLALLQALLGLGGARRDRPEWMAAARGAAVAQALFVAAGFAALCWSFVVNDFSVMNVAEHSSRQLDLAYRITAAWGSHEGSFLLWALLLGGWTVAFLGLGRRLPAVFAARVTGVLGLLSFAFLAFVLLTSNPFLRLHPPPADGADLNPLLQDPGMVIHPPLLYMGYVGFALAFAFAVAALLAGELDEAWAQRLRPWALAAWVCLTAGIAIGSWWAYVELGWGGWWFWDPSENASLMPWLAGTALLHALVVTGQRGALRAWSAFLALATFALSLLGTFLIRSGVLSSVHAFAKDPRRGLFILVFLAILIGGSLWLYGRRAATIHRRAPAAPLSRETAMLAGTVLLLVALGVVMLGTLYPLVLDALDLGKISVGPPYFDAVIVPTMVPVLLLLAATPWLRWGRSPAHELPRRLGLPLLLAVVAAATLPLLAGTWRWQAGLGIGLGVWVLAATAGVLFERRRAQGRLPLRALGMGLAHAGLAIGIIGMGLVSAGQTERTVAMHPGDTAQLGAYEFVFRGAQEVPAGNYSAMRGTLEVREHGRPLAVLEPEKRLYRKSGQTMTEAAIRYGILGDVYVALGEPLPGRAWSVQLYLKPFVGWLWAGALLMVLGGALAALDRTRRTAGRTVGSTTHHPAPTGEPA